MPLLPHNKIRDNPLFIVLAILAFLATISLLSLATSHQIASTWSRDLTNTATAQIKPGTQENGAALARRAKDILRASPNIANVDILPLAHSRDLLRPWLGNVLLPDDLPLPIILHIQIHPNKTLDITGLQNVFTQAGIRADIDTHHRWNKELKAKTRALQMLTLTALVPHPYCHYCSLYFCSSCQSYGKQKAHACVHSNRSPAAIYTEIIERTFCVYKF